MPRAARVVAVGVPHHVVQRGNNRQDVFFVNDDRHLYIRLLREQTQRHGLQVQAYCLMTNHVHLVVVPSAKDSLANALGRTHFLYTQAVNRLHRRSGHLWQNRFYSCPLDEVHYWTALCYVERNPVRARMVRKAWLYPWSSAHAHVSGEDRNKLLDLSKWPKGEGGGRWQRQLESPQEDQVLGRMRWALRRGLPLGTDSFISKLEVTLGRRLRPPPMGRPRKKTAAKRRSNGRKRAKKRKK